MKYDSRHKSNFHKMEDIRLLRFIACLNATPTDQSNKMVKWAFFMLVKNWILSLAFLMHLSLYVVLNFNFAMWFDVGLIRYYIVLSRLSDRQDKEMDYLNLFIDYHYKSIVSIIWGRHILTLHLSHANWRKLKLSHCW